MPQFSQQETNTLGSMWNNCVLDQDKINTITRAAQLTWSNQKIYQLASDKTPNRIPWQFIAGLHMRESFFDFSCNLMNGEPLSKTTKLDPRGFGPWKDWQSSAFDALQHEGLFSINNWTIEKMLFYSEKFNGFGYRGKEPSPYVWACTNHCDGTGYYTHDGIYSISANSEAYAGTGALWKYLEQMMHMELPREITSISPIESKPQESENKSQSTSLNTIGRLINWLKSLFHRVVDVAIPAH